MRAEQTINTVHFDHIKGKITITIREKTKFHI